VDGEHIGGRFALRLRAAGIRKPRL